MYPSQTSRARDSRFDSAQTALALEGKHVLLAEDCVGQGRLCLKTLQSAGADVTLECNGQSVVDAVRKSPTLFDAVVMDFLMPKMDGLDATRQLRCLGYTETIIGVIAFGSIDLERSWFQAGCNDCLKKPVNKHQLISAVLRHTTASYTQHEELGVPLDETQRRENLRAIAVLPIRHQGEVIGCLNVASHTLDWITYSNAETTPTQLQVRDLNSFCLT